MGDAILFAICAALLYYVLDSIAKDHPDEITRPMMVFQGTAIYSMSYGCLCALHPHLAHEHPIPSLGLSILLALALIVIRSTLFSRIEGNLLDYPEGKAQ